MIKVAAEEFIHGLSGYLKAVKKGERIVILKGGVPVADFVPHNKDLNASNLDKKLITRLKKGHEDAQKMKGRFVK